MRKRLFCLAAVMLLLLAAPARAEDYPLEVKLVRQFQESAYRGTVTVQAEGETAFFGEELWALIKAAAPRLSVQVNHSRQRGHSQTTAELLIDGESVGITDLREDGVLYAFASDLMAGADTFYAFSADTDVSEWLSSLTEQEGAWPSVWPILLSVSRADGEWNARAEKHFEALQMEMEIWLGEMALYDTGTAEDGTEYTELSCVIPDWEVKDEIGRLLSQVYRNEELLGLLREICPGKAQVYLQPGCLNALLQAVNALPLSGDVILVRRFDASGHPLLDEVSLPLAEGAFAEKIVFTARPRDGGRETAVRVFLRDASQARIAWTDAGQQAWAGEIEWTGTDGEPLALAWDLQWEMGEETFNLSSDKFEKTLRGEMNLSPLNGSGFPAQRLTMEALLYSGSMQSSPTHLNGTLAWTDAESGGKIILTLESRTAAPFAVEEIEEDNCLRLDEADMETVLSLAVRWAESAGDWTERTARLLMGE